MYKKVIRLKRKILFSFGKFLSEIIYSLIRNQIYTMDLFESLKIFFLIAVSLMKITQKEDLLTNNTLVSDTMISLRSYLKEYNLRCISSYVAICSDKLSEKTISLALGVSALPRLA